MALYDIAGLCVSMNVGGRTLKQAEKYLSKNQNKTPDIKINVSKKRIEDAVKDHPELSEDDWEYLLTGSDFYTYLLDFDGMLLHSSCVVVNDSAYLFSADSGTGKSTHTNLWLEKFKENAYILNDDKPAIRKIDGKIYACGTPWSGKYDISRPNIVPVAAIALLQRNDTNYIKPAETKKGVFTIFSQTVRRLNKEHINKLFDNVEMLFENIPIYEFGCNISQDAVTVAYNTMKPKEK